MSYLIVSKTCLKYKNNLFEYSMPCINLKFLYESKDIKKKFDFFFLYLCISIILDRFIERSKICCLDQITSVGISIINL